MTEELSQNELNQLAKLNACIHDLISMWYKEVENRQHGARR